MKPDCCSTSAAHHFHHQHNNHSAIVSLNSRQIERLRSVLSQDVQVHGRENFPTLEVPLHTFIVNVRRKLLDAELPLEHIKLNGGAAGFVFANNDYFPYSDVDLIFSLSLMQDHDFDRIRQAVFDALLEMMPSSTNKEMISIDTLREVYIRKMVKVTDGDRWSLFSLNNDYGRCIELKFVEKMRRQFEFSVDSFQITLDPLIDNLLGEKHPTIKAESVFGDFQKSMYHLNKQLIDTRNPEEIRGGGLLKYCHLLTRGYLATPNCCDMEKYMCSRFFIDFPDVQAQEMKLCCYLQNHFGNEDQMKLDYLQMLYHVIRESTVCLMSHERRQTLTMVDRMRQQLSYTMGLYFVPAGTVYSTAATPTHIPYQQLSHNNNNHNHHHNSNHQQQLQQMPQLLCNHHQQSYGGCGGTTQPSRNYRRHHERHRSYNSNNSNSSCHTNSIAQGGYNYYNQSSGGHQGYWYSSSPSSLSSPGSNNNYQQNRKTMGSVVSSSGVSCSTAEASEAINGGFSPSKSEEMGTTFSAAALSPESDGSSNNSSGSSGGSIHHVPRQTLLYLPPNASHWIPVV